MEIFLPQLWQYIVSPSGSVADWVLLASVMVRIAVWILSLLASIITPPILGASLVTRGTTNEKKVKNTVAIAQIAPTIVSAIAALWGSSAASSFSRNGPAVTRELMPSARKTMASTIVKHHTMRAVLMILSKSFFVVYCFHNSPHTSW